MNRFYILLWLKWFIRVSFCSILIALFISSAVTIYIFFKTSPDSLDGNVLKALFDIERFWFALSFNFAFLFVLFRSIKYIFNKKLDGYEYKLYNCSMQNIDVIGYGDLIKVWRKWFFMLIWFSAVEMVIVTIIFYLFGIDELFSWFNIYVLYSFVMIAGYFSFILLPSRCKRVRIVRC